MNIATFGSLLLLSTALVAPAALAQGTGSTPSTQAESPPDAGQEPDTPAEGVTEEEVEVSAPGADPTDQPADEGLVVVGRRVPNVVRRSPEVVSVLSSADIARTGEGDIAGALQRVTGLSLVGGRFVYVRGLGERYSLALLNGLPLPSPDPLRRVVPLDIFPTSVIASSLVQKSYSVNYPGEFGGGVINLTTKSAPREPFLSFGASIGGDDITTGNLGYTYYGSDTDFTGFDDGTRDVPPLLQRAINSNQLIVPGTNFSQGDLELITSQLVNAPTTLIQRNNSIQPNVGFNMSGGFRQDVGDQTVSLLFGAGFSNNWQTKGGLQQVAAGVTPIDGQNTLNPDVDYRFLSTENRVLVNAIAAFGLEVGEHQLRWTNLFIRDTLKEARIQDGLNQINVGDDRVNISNTAWFERQLIDTQLVAELEFGALGIDLRGSYAQAQRESPYERTISYRFNEDVGDFTNDLRRNGEVARIAFSDLTDDVYAGGADVSYQLPDPNITFSAGYAYTKNERISTRRDFRYVPRDVLPLEVSQQRPDFLLSDFNVFTFDITLIDVSGTAGAARYTADLEVHAGYAQADWEIMDGLRLQAGVRYEDGVQIVRPVDIFGTGGVDIIPSVIDEDYFLPAATLTYTPAPDMQIRLHGSKTIARPQFRELSPQQYQDPDTDRTFFGNQFLIDSELINAEARYEWYFGRDERFSVAGFYKDIENPIEAVAFQQGGTFFTTFANAPKATLYGGEVELQKFFPLEGLGSPIFATRRGVLIANYTYTKSEIKVGENDTTIPVGTGGQPVPAANVFDEGAPLTGQSDHIANLQIGLENTDRLSQQTFLLSYASRRVTNRGQGEQPDIREEPGLRLDFVAREGFEILGREGEIKFEARNLTGENYEEFQTLNGSRVDYNTFDVGRSFSLGVSFSL